MAAVSEHESDNFCCSSVRFFLADLVAEVFGRFFGSDSVAVMRFAMGAGRDGAVQSRPGTVFYSFFASMRRRT